MFCLFQLSFSRLLMAVLAISVALVKIPALFSLPLCVPFPRTLTSYVLGSLCLVVVPICLVIRCVSFKLLICNVILLSDVWNHAFLSMKI